MIDILNTELYILKHLPTYHRLSNRKFRWLYNFSWGRWARSYCEAAGSAVVVPQQARQAAVMMTTLMTLMMTRTKSKAAAVIRTREASALSCPHSRQTPKRLRQLRRDPLLLRPQKLNFSIRLKMIHHRPRPDRRFQISFPPNHSTTHLTYKIEKKNWNQKSHETHCTKHPTMEKLEVVCFFYVDFSDFIC